MGRTRPEPVLPATKRALYISPKGGDRNPGTLQKPFRTLQAAQWAEAARRVSPRI